VLSHGRSGWPVWVHHAHREQHWRGLEIIEPDTAAASPADANRYSNNPEQCKYVSSRRCSL
jgi:hypothetical protein